MLGWLRIENSGGVLKSTPAGKRGSARKRNVRFVKAVPAGAEWGPGFDAEHATDAWIATIPAAEREKSDAYFEGGYWIEAWGALVTVAIAWILLETRLSARLRDFSERRARKPFRQTLIYAALFLLALVATHHYLRGGGMAATGRRSTTPSPSQGEGGGGGQVLRCGDAVMAPPSRPSP